jgi:cation diffusion facilitator CzcD-associated flavoprotein CzcO
MTAVEVVVVGAGPAGLAAAAGLRSAGFHPVVIERAQSIGSAWYTRYDAFRLHTARRWSGLPGLAIPATSGSWVSRDDFIDYLESYADRFAIAARLGVECTGLGRVSGGWRLQTTAGELDARRVVLATGACSRPSIPNWSGWSSFPGRIIHSSEYRNPNGYAGQRVLVVGSGNSASEIAADLAWEGSIQVEVAVRTPPVILRRATYGLPTQVIGVMTRHLPPAVMNPLAATTRWISVPDLEPYALPAPRAPYTQIRRTGTLPLLDHGFVAALRAGAITIRAGVAAMSGDTVIHSDGTESRPDTVIAATGYTADLDSILAPLGQLDDRGRPAFGPRGTDGREGLHAVGFGVVLSGVLREIGLDARRLLRAIGPV